MDEILKSSLNPDDLEVSQAVGRYLLERNVQGIVFSSASGPGANLIVFKETSPPPQVDINNRREVMEALERFAERIRP